MHRRAGSAELLVFFLFHVALLAITAAVCVLSSGDSTPAVRASLVVGGIAGGVAGVAGQVLLCSAVPLHWRVYQSLALWAMAGWVASLVTPASARDWWFAFAVLAAGAFSVDAVVTSFARQAPRSRLQFTLYQWLAVFVGAALVLGLADIPAHDQLESQMIYDVGFLAILTLNHVLAARLVAEISSPPLFLATSVAIGVTLPLIGLVLPFHGKALRSGGALWFGYAQMAILIVANRRLWWIKQTCGAQREMETREQPL